MVCHYQRLFTALAKGLALGTLIVDDDVVLGILRHVTITCEFKFAFRAVAYDNYLLYYNYDVS